MIGIRLSRWEPRLAVHKVITWYDSPALPWVIIGLGALFRLAHYLRNPSLWIDEAALALNIVSLPLSDLRGYLEYHTGAPIGFLMLQKWATELLGNNEYSLRLLPLLAGVGSLVLLYPVARGLLAPRAVPIALVLFACSTSLVRFSNLAKQYSCDVFLAILLVLITMQVIKQQYAVKWLVVYALVGAIAIWLSYPIVFVMAGSGIVVGWQVVRMKEWSRWVQLGIIGIVWLTSFALSFQSSSTSELVEEGIIEVLSPHFAPIPPASLGDVRWLLDNAFGLFSVPGGIALTGIAMLAFLMGCASLWRTGRQYLFLLILPVVATLLVSGMQLYPFWDRFILFLMPLFLLLVAEGAAFILAKTRETYAAIGVTLVALMLIHPVSSEFFRLLIEPRGTEAIRPVFQYINAHRLPGDQLYVYPGASITFTYYADRFQIEDDQYIMGESGDETSSAGLEKIVAEIDQLRGNDRVWFLFSKVKSRDFGLRQGGPINEESFYLYHLDRVGTRLDEYRVHLATAYLYDLNPVGEIGPGAGAR